MILHNAYKMIYLLSIFWIPYFIFQKSRQLKTKRDEATESFKAGNLQDAFNHYSTALSIDPNNKTILAKMYCSRATVLAKVIFCHKYSYKRLGPAKKKEFRYFCLFSINLHFLKVRLWFWWWKLFTREIFFLQIDSFDFTNFFFFWPDLFLDNI